MALGYSLTITLKEGTTTIATATVTGLVNTAWAARILTLTEAERNSIGDFDNLRLYVRAHAINADRNQAASVSVASSKVVFT